MVTRAELLRAHRFVRRRIINAVESGDPDAEPTRRGRAAAIGLTLTVIALAVVAARHYTDRPPAWRRSGAVIVERDTGAHYIFVGGVLHPMANYVSARLALGVAAPPLVTVSPSDLQGVPTGPMWGISSAPASIPAARDLVRSWAVCSDRDGVGHLSLGEPVGGAPAAGLVISDQYGTLYQVADGRRAAISSDGIADAQPSDAFLAAIPVVSRVRDAGSTHAPGTLCVVSDGGATRIVVKANAPAVRVAMPAGRAALVRSTVPPNPVEMIAGGVAYPIKDAAALASLGLADATPMTIPPQVLSLAPHGIELSDAAAKAVIES